LIAVKADDDEDVAGFLRAKLKAVPKDSLRGVTVERAVARMKAQNEAAAGSRPDRSLRPLDAS
jgi:hypothetical protein